MTKNLTPFGNALANAIQLRHPSFSTKTRDWLQIYQENINTLKSIQSLIRQKNTVLVVGAGYESKMSSISKSTKNWFKSGVHWTNFHRELKVDLITSTHACTLEAAIHHSKNRPSFLIHGVYSKVPPVFMNSATIMWSDPYIDNGMKDLPTVQDYDDIINKRSKGAIPYLPSVRNTLFLNTMIMIWLGAKNIVFTAVDPHNPDYFFSDDDELTLDIVRCLSMCNPWLAEWDGRNERISLLHRNTSHRIQKFIENLLSQKKSAVGEQSYIEEFDRGFTFLKDFALHRGLNLGYLGDSEYMKTTGIKKLD
ncbi:hypothetical protein Q3Y53_01030 [Synechococcus sp. YX-04-1]|uniref:hypothetical protein n=1 Tax=Synechococcus sp. YX-04-1 TaxID=3062778 RepID=UPI0026E29149|nr:hypothetical protein [Synechococcus sp. YX-04-1]MDO6351112.1 hypothetical protein [Synechococcus sp. YX-04-1]